MNADVDYTERWDSVVQIHF